MKKQLSNAYRNSVEISDEWIKQNIDKTVNDALRDPHKMGQLKNLTTGKKIVNLKETLINCYGMSKDRYLMLLRHHAVILNSEFEAINLQYYDPSKKLKFSGKLTEEQTRFNPLCSYKDDLSGEDTFIIGFQIRGTEEEMEDLKSSTAKSPFDQNKRFKCFYKKGKRTYDTMIAQITFEVNETNRIIPIEPTVSGLIANELITGVFRCDVNRVIMSTYHNQLLLF